MKTLHKGLVLFSALLALSSCAHFLEAEKTEDAAKIHLQVAIDRFNSREYNKAIEACQKAIAIDGKMPESYNHLALIYMETKRYQKSFEAFKKALELRPQYPEVFNNLGVLFNRQEKYNEAIGYFQKALADSAYLTPENPYTNMGYSYFKMGQLTTAKAFHQKALDVVPNFCLAGKNLGDVYVKEKRFSQAEKYFRKAVRNCPLYQEARYKLGLVLVKMGDRKMAKAELGKLVKQHKDGPYVDRTQEVLKLLQ